MSNTSEAPEDIRKLAESYAGRMADTLLGTGSDPDFIAILCDAILADRAARQAEPVAWPGGREQKLLSQIANAVFANREATESGHAMAAEIQRDCLARFEALGLSDEGDGWGFSDESLEQFYAAPQPEPAPVAGVGVVLDALMAVQPNAGGFIDRELAIAAVRSALTPVKPEPDPMAVAVEVLRDECASLGSSIESFWCMTAPNTDNRLLAEDAQRSVKRLSDLLETLRRGK